MSLQEAVTEPLNVEQLREGVSEIACLLASACPDTVSVHYGWACNLPIDHLWERINVPPRQLEEFVEQSEKLGIFKLGASDLIIECPEGTPKFTLCHESDIHFVAGDDVLFAKVVRSWRTKGIKVYTSPYTPVGRPDWKLEP